MTAAVVVLGLPSAGKSSFIAALSHILQFKEVPTVLKFDKLSAEDKYLFELRLHGRTVSPSAELPGGQSTASLSTLRMTRETSSTSRFLTLSARSSKNNGAAASGAPSSPLRPRWQRAYCFSSTRLR